MVYVKDSDQFILLAEDAISEFSVGGHKVYAKIEGVNIQEIIVDGDGTLRLTGEDMEYEVVVDVYADGRGRIETVGKGSGTIEIEREK